jgi:hypothetical protein
MTTIAAAAREAHLELPAGTLDSCFDTEPFGFDHTLNTLDLFSPDSLRRLAEVFADYPADYFVSASAPGPDVEFYSMPHGGYLPHQAIGLLDSQPTRILLKRPEDHDKRFRELLDTLFHQVMALRGGLRGETLVRLEGGIFISSAASTTPFHFDPEINFFSQIEGEKIYHIYPPHSVTEAELEQFYIRGAVAIGQVPLKGREGERVFTLGPGKGLHQPQNAPHWVQTQGSRSVSYAFVFETDATRARGRVRSFNHLLRGLGADPVPPGVKRGSDAVKAAAMRIGIPLRQLGGSLLRVAGLRH